MRKLVVLLAFIVIMPSVAVVLAACGPSAPTEHPAAIPTNATVTPLEGSTAAPSAVHSASTHTPVPTNQPAATGSYVAVPSPTNTVAPQQEAAATASYTEVPPSTPIHTPSDDDGLEFLSADSLGISARDGGINGVDRKPTRKDDSSTGPVRGQPFTWEDGDRTLTVYRQSGLAVEEGTDGLPRDVVEVDHGATNVARGAEGKSKSETLPVFRSESGALMTLPGGVLLVLSAEWNESETNAFFSNNGIKMKLVSELSYVANGFFIETEPGFPSLDLANRLAVLDGVEVSSPNWGREAVKK